jgi:hypothetical protein
MNKLLVSFVMLGLILVGCGGGSNSSNQTLDDLKFTINQPIVTIIEAAIRAEDFVALTVNANCANTRNRLFVIDAKYVLWDKAGTCADAAYSQTLFGRTPQSVLCTNSDTIAGPRSSCTDQQYASLFQTILGNLDKPDLGLGSSHRLVTVPLLVAKSSISAHLGSFPSQFVSLRLHLHYGTPPSNIVIKDQKAWEDFLAQARVSNINVGDGLSVDFSKQMVLGVFFKAPNNCSSVKLLKLMLDGQKLRAEYVSDERVSIQSCDPSSNLSSTPMNLVVVNRLDVSVEFIDVSAGRVNFTPLVQTDTLGFAIPILHVVRDNDSWTSVKSNYPWDPIFAQAQFAEIRTRSFDFSSRMLIGEFIGKFNNSCYQLGEIYVWRSNNNLNVASSVSFPVSDSVCAPEGSLPAYLIELDRNESKLEISTIPNSL